MDATRFDFSIVGGGAAGFAAATRANELGRKTLMVNAGLPIGGTCVNVGCVPSKVLLELAARFHDAAHPRYRALGATGYPVAPDFSEAIREKNEIVQKARGDNYVKVLESLEHVRFVEGRGKFLSSKRIEAAGRIFAAEKILIATGAATAPLSIPGMERITWHTNETIMDLPSLPGELVVIGGGPEGLEFAQIFSRLGSRVTVIVTEGHKILRREEPDAVAELVKALKEEGIRFLTAVKVEAVSERAGRRVLTIQSHGPLDTVEADEILISAGRRANTAGLGLEAAGVKIDRRGRIEVDARFETAAPGVFAAGDCIGTMPLETVAAKEGARAAENALTGAAKGIDYDHVPHAVFTSPQLASVGLTEEEEMRRLGRCLCRTISMDAVPRAGITRESRGLFKMIAHPENRRILGMHIVAPNAAELIHEAALAVRFGLTVQDLVDTLHVFPTMSEGIKRAAQAFTRDVSKMACCVE